MAESRAALALAAVLKNVPAASEENGNFRVLDAWTEGEDTICVVYRGWWEEQALGLRRTLDADIPLDVMVGQILDAELGEPPGGMIEGVDPDVDGITWWQGEPREWWRN